MKSDSATTSLRVYDIKQAAANGDADAQWKLARLYAEGEVVREDLANRAKWSR